MRRPQSGSPPRRPKGNAALFSRHSPSSSSRTSLKPCRRDAQLFTRPEGHPLLRPSAGLPVGALDLLRGTASVIETNIRDAKGRPSWDNQSLSPAREPLQCPRHANATQMVAGGTDPKTAQTRLGHSDIRLTLGLYSDAVEAADRKAEETWVGCFSERGRRECVMSTQDERHLSRDEREMIYPLKGLSSREVPFRNAVTRTYRVEATSFSPAYPCL